MSKILALALAAVLSTAACAAEPVKEKACVESKDAKTGKVTMTCKEIKKHKKLESTEVPKK